MYKPIVGLDLRLARMFTRRKKIASLCRIQKQHAQILPHDCLPLAVMYHRHDKEGQRDGQQHAAPVEEGALRASHKDGH